MKKLLLLTNFLAFLFVTAQTVLNKGDIMVLGVNANSKNNTCSGVNTDPDYDNIYFISFVDIVNTTTFEITDNRYISANNFGNSEGFIRFRRTGGTIPRGTVFKIDIPNALAQNDVLNGWVVNYKHGSFGLNSGNNNGDGDQFLLFQNANWDTSGSISGANLKYLFAYNSRNVWNNTNNSTSSLLPGTSPNDLRCYHISSPSTLARRHFGYYNATTFENLSIGEWQVRILNNANWTNATNCSNFNSNVFMGTLSIRTSHEQEICSDETLDDLNVVNESNVILYQWFRNTIPSTVGADPVGTNSFSYTPSNTLEGTYYYYCEMVIDLPLNGVSYPSCTFTSNVFKVTVHPNPITSPVTPL